LRQVERTLYRFYRVLCIDSLIDGYFGWPAVLRELRRKGVPERKLHVVENAVDTQMFAPLAADEREAVRRRLGIAQDEFVIGWVGRISLDMQVRNTVLLVEALARRGLGRLRLLVVGGGPWEEGLRQMLVGLSLDKLAILTGWVPMEDVNELIAAMDVVPLLEEDPQGGSIVREAMACGRVALSVDGASGTQRRFMLPGCAFLVPTDGFIEEAADVVEQLVARPRLVAATGVAARAYACEEMSFDRQVKALSDVFTSVGKQR
jgi:glycosyltransferase involved in cell wall biosynthesis